MQVRFAHFLRSQGDNVETLESYDLESEEKVGQALYIIALGKAKSKANIIIF